MLWQNESDQMSLESQKGNVQKLSGKGAYELLQLSGAEGSDSEDRTNLETGTSLKSKDEDASSMASSTEDAVVEVAQKKIEVNDQRSPNRKAANLEVGKKQGRKRASITEGTSDESDDSAIEEPVKPKKKLTDGKKMDNNKSTKAPAKNSAISKATKKGSKGSKEGDDELGRYKSYLKEAGIKIQNYAKFFGGQTSVKKQKEKILQTLKDSGLEGRPSLEACKRLKEKRETEAEIASLNQNLIISGPRRTRGAAAELQEKSEAKNRAAMLQKVTKQIKRKLTDTDEEQVEEVDVGALAYKSDDESVTDAFANLRDCVASDSE